MFRAETNNAKNTKQRNTIYLSGDTKTTGHTQAIESFVAERNRSILLAWKYEIGQLRSVGVLILHSAANELSSN